ncbi:MAG: HepT-like ribonuclease domain-containing protein [Fimbriimonadales bacterium]
MQRNAGKWLEDVLTEGSDALEFLAGKSQDDYLADKGLRAMVERKLFVVGEAMSQLRSNFPEVAEGLLDVREIVAFRNLLAHGYFALDHRRVYDIATTSLPALLADVEEALKRFP